MGKVVSQVLWLQANFKKIITVMITIIVTGMGGAVWGGIIEPSTRSNADKIIEKRMDGLELETAKKVDKSVFDITVENFRRDITEMKQSQQKQNETLIEILKEVKR